MPKKIEYLAAGENFPGADFTPDEWEFIRAVRAYQARTKRRYPTWREILAVARELGYRKVPPPEEPPCH